MKKILVIEDEKTLLVAIKSKLEIEGYEVLCAEDGEEGLKLAESEKLDLILLDILLPKKNGFEILEQLGKSGNKTPVIVISNSGQPVEIDRATKLGVKDYLVKADFTPDEVTEKVKKVIGEGFPPLPENDSQNTAEEGGVENFPTIEESAPSSKGSNVLVVEDDGFLREVITKKLTNEGFVVRSAIDADEAFKEIEKGNPQIILLDLILPGVDGYGILSKLKKSPSTREIPVIVLSNLGQEEDIERALSEGAVDYLIKANFTPGEIVQKIRGVLNKKYF